MTKTNDGEPDMTEHIRSMPIPIVAPTPLDMLNRAVASGASMELVERLMALHERYEANAARKAFDAAIAAAKAEIRPIIRTATGHNAKKYADFASIAREVDPKLAAHGLGYRFRTTQTDRITVTCVLFHEAGHREENTLAGPPDTSGNKNAIQAIGSTLTYLQRYSLVQALGLAAADDDDGNGSTDTGELITAMQAKELAEAITSTGGDVGKFCKFMRIDTLAELPAARYEAAMVAVERAAKARKGEKKVPSNGN